MVAPPSLIGAVNVTLAVVAPVAVAVPIVGGAGIFFGSPIDQLTNAPGVPPPMFTPLINILLFLRM
jgi:hypothetical protein